VRAGAGPRPRTPRLWVDRNQHSQNASDDARSRASRHPASHRDEDLATAILSSLKWQEDFPKDAIQVEVERGCVTLGGEVDWGYQRHAAEMLVSRMRGVLGVSNRITVRADVVAADVGTQISAALARRAQREFAGIAIDVHDGVVTLTGTVSSLAEKRAACGAAWSAKGVQRVVEKLSVV